MKTFISMMLTALFIGVGSDNPFSQLPANNDYNAQSKSITVPEVKARSVVIDGFFATGEWDDAIHFPISEKVEIYFMASPENLYVGWKFIGEFLGEAVSEIYIALDSKEFYNLHSSGASGEGVNIFSDDFKSTKFTVGNNKDWESNPGKRGEVACYGKEYRIRLNKFGTASLKFAGGIIFVNNSMRENAHFPQSYDFKNSDKWVELINPSAFPGLTGLYLGQQPPGMTPEIFVPEILTSQKHPHGSMAFSKDGSSIYWSAMLKDGPEQTIFFSEFDGKSLSMPLKAAFAADSGNGGPSFSSDGRRIYFSSIMPGIVQKGNRPTSICYTEWNNSRWSSPVVIEVTRDTIMTKGQVSVARSGNIYFSGRKYDERMPSIYVCRSEGGKILAPEKIKGKILEAGLIVDPWVDPEEKYLLVSCQPEQGPPMRTDIGISFREADGSWSKPRKLNATINTTDFERFASITPDGEYLFFIRSASYQFVGDGAHFYWVSAKIIEELRPKE